MPHRFTYPGTNVLRNLDGIRDQKALDKVERNASELRAAQPLPREFTPDMDGLRMAHHHLFQDVYEWAGKTRGDELTIEGETFTPEDHTLTKGSATFDLPSTWRDKLPEILAEGRDRLDRPDGEPGRPTQERWASVTAVQIGNVNAAHPFREGNGRAMRLFVERSAERYGYAIKTRELSLEQWMQGTISAARGDHVPLATTLLRRSEDRGLPEKRRDDRDFDVERD